jgi:hypothetical protein
LGWQQQRRKPPFSNKSYEMTPAQIEGIKIGAGTGTTAVAQVAAYSVAVDPVLHVIALLVSIVVGVLTAVWTAIQITTWYKNRKQ